jgi:LPS-assembly lipoprotein
MKLLSISSQMLHIMDRSFCKKNSQIRKISSLYALIIASIALSGCGFHSLYGEDVNNGTVSEDLKQIYIARIPNRVGQVLRESLQQDMAGNGSKAESRYVLRVQPAFDAEDVDIHADNTSGWTRLVGRAHWQLFTLAEHPKLLAQGQSRVLDGYTVTYAEPFAQRLNDETALSRMAHALGADITQQVATWFRTGVKEKGDECINVAQSSCSSQSPTFQAYPIPNAMPGAYGRNALMQSGEDGVPGIASGRVEVGAGRF